MSALMTRLRGLPVAFLLGGCAGDLDWHWPVLHWTIGIAGGLVIGLAISYGWHRAVKHHLRALRRADREDQRP
jgi:NhaP-type Na+/H+ or K+/H+ antiporter